MLQVTMHPSKQHTNQESILFLLRSYTSKEDFVRKYRKLYNGEPKAEELYLLILIELEKATLDGNIDKLKKLSNLIIYINDIERRKTLRDYYNNSGNPIKSTNLVVLACKHNKENILDYLFVGNDSKILNNLSVDIGRNAILPEDEDETCHNAFYYAIRSGNIKLIEILISKWPENYFAIHLDELDEILSRAYEELKLKNVPLSDEMETFVENKLINLRFFSNTSRQNQHFESDLINVRDRVALVLKNISLLKTEYSNKQKLDMKFLFIAKFIAKNVYILKHQLKSTYNRLPWEEIEFCLVSFVTSHTKQREINIVCYATLNKSKILNHLENFAKKLVDEKNICVNIELPKLKREKIVAEIISNYPEFEELYNDHQQIRDIYSLQKISDYIKLALLTDPKEREGQLIITRVLQVIGENLKNSLESPKLSNITGDLFLLSLPKNTRNIIMDLRNSFSHAYSLSKRTEVEENRDVNFFIGVQNDIKKVGNVVRDVLYNNKIKMIRILLKKIANSETLEETLEIAEIFRNVQFNKILSEMVLEKCQMLEPDKLEKLIKELSDNITDKTVYEKSLFNRIDNIMNFKITKSENIQTDYITGFGLLNSISNELTNNKVDHNVIRTIKFIASKTLENIPECKMEVQSLKEIAELSHQICDSVRSRIQDDNLDKVNKLTWEIFYIAEFGTGDIKWIEKLREKLKEKVFFAPIYKQRKTYKVTEEKYNSQLALKLSEMKSILSNNALIGKLTGQVTSYKNNKKLQALVEMLVLDIMSILGSSKKYLENNLLYLDDNTPLLTGKCLRNHLAHDNTLVDVLLSDPSIAIFLNAKKLISENIVKNKKKIGKLVRDNPSKLKDKYDKSLATITIQEKMFAALEEGNLEDVWSYLKKGADINAKSMNSWTSLHFGARGLNLEVIKFIFNQNLDANAKNIKGENSLHIAAAYGRKNNVEFFIKKAGLNVDDLDNSGKTPLHIAAQNGHKDTVEILLKHNANTNAQDPAGFSPLHYAIRNNHIDAAKVLLKRELDVDINETMGGFTSLHIAAECGHLELVNFLLKNKANVNAKNDKEGIPLHTAALNGHLEVVNALILKGADVNTRVLSGCTPLHYAVENGHMKVANILLEHGANVNTVDKTYNNTPLHFAAKDGHEEIVKALLKNKANASIATVEGITPLHFAAQSGHLKIVVAFLKHGVNIHAKDRNKATPLHYAAESGHKEVAELLIKNGAEVDAKDNNFTPLHVAALKGHKEVADLLIRNKAAVNTRDIKCNTPLHAAAMHGIKDIVEVLVKNKAEVNARTNDGYTALHVAALNGQGDTIDLLIKSKADVNTTANYNITPLHAATMRGHKHIVNILIKNKACVNAGGTGDITPLHMAVEAGHKEVIEILIANGADINAKSKRNLTLLSSAVKHNSKEIVEVLVANGANVNEEGNESLLLAVLAENKDIVEVLLKNKASVNTQGPENATPLHLAASRGNKEIVNALVARGADVNTITVNNVTPLFLAAQEGHAEVIEVLIANGARINIKSLEGVTPLHTSARNGHNNVVKVLLDNKAIVGVKDYKNRVALELAVAHGHLQVVKMLLQYEKVDMNTKSNDDWTILHIAAQENNIEMVKYLVDKGSDINARNASGSKPIHIAAREGHKSTVEFFLSKGSSINDPGAVNQTLVHYAAMKGHLEVLQYLIAQGADINVKDANGLLPIHIAAHFGYKNVIEVLLENGAIFNVVDNFYCRPLDKATDKSVINLLSSTEKLFEAVKRNSYSEIENNIKAGAFVNAKNVDRGTPLHYAAWKGHEEVVTVLLVNKANPNAVGSKGVTPLHYAAKFSHLKIVKALLSSGAVYNAISDSGKTPSDFTTDKSIINLFDLLNESFKNIKNGNSKVINDLNRINDADTIKAVLGARNRENKTLVVAAMHSNFSKVKQLKQVSQGDVSTQINIALMLSSRGNYHEALNIYKSVFEKRKNILGPDNPGTLDIQTYMAQVIYKQGDYRVALNMFEEIFQKQKKMLGLHDKDTLKTRSVIALVLHRQGKDEEAFKVYQEVYQKQTELLGSNHSDTLDTQFHMALVLDRQGKYEEALNINRTIFEIRKDRLGANDPTTVAAQNNIAMVLVNQAKYEEALKIYKEVFEKKVILGINHADTLRTSHNIAGILLKQGKYNEALKVHQEVLNIQKSVLGQNHPDTLNSQYNLGNVFFAQGKHISAFKTYREGFDRMKVVFGPDHPTVLDISKKIKVINLKFKLEGSNELEVLQHLQKDINIAASNGDVQTIWRLLKEGADINDTDIEGRTPLHFTVSNGHIGVVSMLLKNGADVTQVTNKGNTPLHTAASKGDNEIIEVLLQHISQGKLNVFINARTTSGGTTSLHVAAKSGFLEVVKSLLKYGATFDIENKEGKIPLDLSKDPSVTKLLQLVEDLFKDAKTGNIGITNKLKAVKPDEFVAVTNARDSQGNTLLQVVIINKHKNIASKLLEMLKELGQH